MMIIIIGVTIMIAAPGSAPLAVRCARTAAPTYPTAKPFGPVRRADGRETLTAAPPTSTHEPGRQR
jgi:hypothetical protein